MNVSEIIAALDSQDDALPREALEEAMARPAEVTEPLLELAREVVRDPAKTLDPENNSMGYVLAFFLLAQFRERRACPVLVETLSLPGVDMDALFGDVLIEDMARILASVSGGETLEIRALIENPEIDPRVRGAALGALFCLVYCDVVERQEAVEYLAELFHDKLERQPSKVWTALVRTASNLGPEELYDEIRQAHDEGLLVGRGIDYLMDEVDDQRVWGLEAGSPQLAHTGAHFLIGNTLREIGWSAVFSEETRLRSSDYSEESSMEA